MAPFLGALTGGLVYDAFLFTGGDSIINAPNAEARAHHEHAKNQAIKKYPQEIEGMV